MIFTDKSFSPPDVSLKRRYYEGFTLFDKSSGKMSAEESLGFEETEDGIKTSYGKEDFKLGESVFALPAGVKVQKLMSYTYRSGVSDNYGNILFIYCSDEYLYKYSAEDGLIKTNIAFSAPPEGINYRTPQGEDIMLFIGKPYSYKFTGVTSTYKIMSSAPSSSCAAVHYERLFSVDSSYDAKVCFSAALDIEDWESGIQKAGYIEAYDDTGKVLRAFALDNRLYLMRERGITRLRALGDNLNFSLRRVSAFTGKIDGKSCCLCGSRIVFLSDAGIYLFNGEKSERVCDELFMRIDEVLSYACFFRNRYFVAVKLKSGETATLCMDAEAKKGFFLPFGTYYPAEFKGDLLFSDGEKILRLSDENEEGECVWESGFTDFSLGGRMKYLKNIFVKGEGDYILTVYADGGGYSKYSSDNKFSPMLRGRKFNIKIAAKKAELKGMEAEIYEDRYY